jgi:hypothetical protein
MSNVEFYANGTKIGQDTLFPYSMVWSNPAAGANQIVAVGTDTAGLSMTSAPITINVSAPALPSQLISFGDVWKYLDDGSNQGTSWRLRTFNDASWMAAPAQFGYGAKGERTTISYGTNASVRYITAYFRKPVYIPNPSIYNGFLLQLLRDDGAVVYVNGTEVLRDNLLSSQVNWNSLAVANLDPPVESVMLQTNLPSSLFIAGTNVIAVELHQSSISSSDAIFDLAMLGLTSTNTSFGIYLASPGNNAHFNTPARVPLSAFAQANGSPISLVEYFDGATKIGQATTAPYSLTWSNGPIGSHAITARATYGASQTITSDPLNISITAPPPPIIPVDQTYIAAGSTWQYWDNVTPVATGWHTTSFDDSAWPSGPARFGWGLDGEVTPLTQGRITHYFRRWFVVNLPGLITELNFGLVRDDGAVVYLNGVEVFRSNMPNGPVNASTLASTTANTPDETTYFSYKLNTAGLDLTAGSNLISVELHQASATSSDAGFDLELFGTGTSEERIYLASPTDGGTYGSPGVVPIEAAAWAGTGHTVSTVEFFAGTNKLGEATSAPYATAWYDPPFGTYQITAQMLDSQGTRMTSAPVNITVSYQSYASQFIISNSVWKYLDNGSNQGTNFAQLAYDETGWNSGLARLGYGGDGEVTTISYGPNASAKYITTYFRQWFNCPSNVVITNLLFRLIRDDGAVVWLNGREVYRSNMPNGPITYQTFASAVVGGTDEQTYFTNILTVTNILSGSNLVAIEMHQADLTSSDLSLALELFGAGYIVPAPVAPPALAFDSTGANIFLRWPSSATGFNLYEAPSLPATWTLVGATPATTNNQKIVTIGTTNGSRFYRLSRP